MRGRTCIMYKLSYRIQDVASKENINLCCNLCSMFLIIINSLILSQHFVTLTQIVLNISITYFP